jgi:hypothetical protein
MFVMTGMEDGRLMKMNRTFSHTHNVTYLSDHGESKISSSLLYHDRFGHINYHNLCLMRNNGIFGLLIIPIKRKQCDACILGKCNKQPFHISTSRACRRLCNPMHVPSDLCNPMHSDSF